MRRFVSCDVFIKSSLSDAIISDAVRKLTLIDSTEPVLREPVRSRMPTYASSPKSCLPLSLYTAIDAT